MRLLHVITGLQRGGAEAMLHKLLSRLDRTRFEPSVVSLTPGGPYVEKIAALGVPVRDLGMRSAVDFPTALLRLRRLVRQQDPAILDCWMYHAAVAALWAAQGRPVIAEIRHSLHDMGNEKFLTRQMIGTLGWMSASTSFLVYNSRASRVQHEARGYDGSRGTVIPNGFSCDFLKPMPEEGAAVRRSLGIPADALVIGHLGRYHAVKDHQTLLKAFAKLVGSHSEAFLVMAGTGVDAGNRVLTEIAGSLGIDDRVRSIGERNDIPAVLSAFDIFANSSRSEAFPNVLGEAMACGVPCVATDVGDSAYVIGTTGMIAPPNDSCALADALAQMAALDRGERLELGQKARARIIENFSIGAVARAYENLYLAAAVEAIPAQSPAQGTAT